MTIDERLKNNPVLAERFKTILDIAERKSQGPDTANAVEERAIVEVRKLGEEVMKEWASNKTIAAVKTVKENNPSAQNNKKKRPIGIPHLGVLMS
jgi:hypothetical protein